MRCCPRTRRFARSGSPAAYGNLLYATTSITRDEYLTSAAVMQGIEIRSENGILEITLPCLHPKRKQQQSTEFLLDPFTAALSQYVKSNPMPRLRQ